MDTQVLHVRGTLARHSIIKSRWMGLLQVFRATHGKTQVWGQAPTFITAKYTTGDGKEKTSLLLTSGKPCHITYMIWGVWHAVMTQ